MKKVTLFAAMAALVFASCNKDENLQFEMSNHTITASMETDSPETRTAFNRDNGALYWIAGDDIAVLNTNGTFTEYTLTEGVGTANGKFTAKAKIGDNTTYALHPYSSGHKYENSALTFNLPTTYTYAETEEGNEYGAAPMIAQTEETDASSFYFEHLGGAFCFTINNLPANTTYFKFEADEQITGEFPVETNTETGKLEISQPNTQTASDNTATPYAVTIHFPAEESATNKKFFIPLPVGTIDGFKISLGTATEETWSYTSTKSNTITRKKLWDMPEVTLNATVDGSVATSVSTADELIAAIAAGGDVTLAKDITLSERLDVKKDLTLDLGGKTLTSTSDKQLAIKNEASLIIKNGKIVSNGVGVQNSGTLTINCNIEATSSAINNVYGCTTTIEGGSYTSTSTEMSLIAIDGKWDKKKTPSVTINGGTFESKFTNVSFNNGAKGAVNAGTFTCTGNLYNIYVGGSAGGCDVTYSADNCTFTSNGANVIVVGGTNVNKVNGTEYTSTTTLLDYASAEEIVAFKNSIAAGGNVTLTKDIILSERLDVKKDLTLDLGGKTLTSTSDKQLAIKNEASLIIKNGKIVSNGVGVQNSGTLTINCNIEATSSAINNVYGCTTTIEGGSYTSTSTEMSLIAIDGKWDKKKTPSVTINGGTFESKFTNVSFNNGAKGAVNAGTFTCTGNLYNIYVGGSAGGCDVTYNADNCTFTSNGANVIVVGGTNVNKVNGTEYTSTTTLLDK